MIYTAPRQGLFAIVIATSLCLHIAFLVVSTEQQITNHRAQKGKRLVKQLVNEASLAIAYDDKVSLSVLAGQYADEYDVTSIVVRDVRDVELTKITESIAADEQGVLVKELAVRNNTIIGEVELTMQAVHISEIFKSLWFFILGSAITHGFMWVFYGHIARPTKEQLKMLRQEIYEHYFAKDHQYLEKSSQNVEDNNHNRIEPEKSKLNNVKDESQQGIRAKQDKHLSQPNVENNLNLDVKHAAKDTEFKIQPDGGINRDRSESRAAPIINQKDATNQSIKKQNNSLGSDSKPNAVNVLAFMNKTNASDNITQSDEINTSIEKNIENNKLQMSIEGQLAKKPLHFEKTASKHTEHHNDSHIDAKVLSEHISEESTNIAFDAQQPSLNTSPDKNITNITNSTSNNPHSNYDNDVSFTNKNLSKPQRFKTSKLASESLSSKKSNTDDEIVEASKDIKSKKNKDNKFNTLTKIFSGWGDKIRDITKKTDKPVAEPTLKPNKRFLGSKSNRDNNISTNVNDININSDTEDNNQRLTIDSANNEQTASQSIDNDFDEGKQEKGNQEKIRYPKFSYTMPHIQEGIEESESLIVNPHSLVSDKSIRKSGAEAITSKSVLKQHNIKNELSAFISQNRYADDKKSKTANKIVNQQNANFFESVKNHDTSIEKLQKKGIRNSVIAPPSIAIETKDNDSDIIEYNATNDILQASSSVKSMQVQIQFVDKRHLINMLSIDKTKEYFDSCNNILNTACNELLSTENIKNIQMINCSMFNSKGAVINLQSSDKKQLVKTSMILGVLLQSINKLVHEARREKQMFSLGMVFGVNNIEQENQMKSLLDNKAKEKEILLLLPENSVHDLQSTITFSRIGKPKNITEKECLFVDKIDTSLISIIDNVTKSVFNQI